MIKLLAFDMDGTLLDENDCISKENEEAIIECQKRGINVILASGRAKNRLVPYAEQLKFKDYGGKFIEVNGMAIYDVKTNTRNVFKQLTVDEIINMWIEFEPYKVEMQVFFDDGIDYYIPEEMIPVKLDEKKKRNLPDDYPILGGPWTECLDCRAGYPKQKRIYSYNELTKSVYNKFDIVANPLIIEKVVDDVYDRYVEKYEIVKSCPRVVEINPKNITKGKTLRRFMKENNLKPDEVMVFGDGENDVDMFKSVKYSFAMENAADYVKKEASYIAPKNTENGIAKVLKEFILDTMNDVH